MAGESTRRWLRFAAAALLIAAAFAVRPLLAAVSPDGQLQQETLLFLDFATVALLGAGSAALLWPLLAERRLRAPLAVLLLLLTLGMRSVRLDAPFLDHHAHKQTNMAAIARNFYEQDPNILWPQVNWRAHAPNYIESQLPLVPWLASRIYPITGEQPWVGRGLVALAAGLQVLAVFGLVSLYGGQAAGFLAALFLALSPMAVYFGRTFMDDTPSLALAATALWAIATWAQRGAPPGRAQRGRTAAWLALGIAALALAVLLKLVTLYIYLPVVVILWQRWGWRMVRQPLAWAILLLPLLPVAAWYAWARHIGQAYLTFGIWGLATNEAAGLAKWGSASLLLSWDFIARIGRRVLTEILTPAMVAPLAIGAALAVRCAVLRLQRQPQAALSTADRAGQGERSALNGPDSRLTQPGDGAAGGVVTGSPADCRGGGLLFGAWLAGGLAFIAVSGQAQWIHDYYQLPLAGILAPFTGLGLAFLWQQRRLWRWAALGLVVLLALLAARQLAAYHMDWHGWVPREVEIIQAITAPDDKVITVTFDNQPILLYHLHRPGWVVDYLQPERLAEVPRFLVLGARVLVLQNIDLPQAAGLWQQPWLAGLELVEQAGQYAIFRVPAGLYRPAICTDACKGATR